jgi:hypothetical protein
MKEEHAFPVHEFYSFLIECVKEVISVVRFKAGAETLEKNGWLE